MCNRFALVPTPVTEAQEEDVKQLRNIVVKLNRLNQSYVDEIELLKHTLETLTVQYHTLQTSVRRGTTEAVGKEGREEEQKKKGNKKGKREREREVVVADLARQVAELDERRAKLGVLERKMARQLHGVLVEERENNGLVEQVAALKSKVHAFSQQPQQQHSQQQQSQQHHQQQQLLVDAFHRCPGYWR